ncbi:MAG: protein kinase [Deltaproteobacteria bacterium]|nr:protein kinase [Deltaproteobacteria bacterium]
MSETPQPTPAVDGAEERFGDYVLVDKIAQGGMAEVYLAKRRGVEGFEKTVAIKRILPELSWNREFVSMFINEAKIAARLSHPNIVQIFDFGKIDNYYFIAMEYLHGENLREILKKSVEKDLRLSSEIAASIAARACAGLEHAHRKTDEAGRPLRIIHRDVSPQNVLVSYDGDVKVVDFGIAKAVAENPEATRGVLKGKLSYLSPEQVHGRNLDARSDIFAMGLVLYELLAGRKLFDRLDPGEVLDGIVRIDSTEVARSLPGLDRDLREVLRRALHVDADQRFQSAGEMQGALERYLRERGDPGGTMQLANLMRLLFDERIGEHTAQTLRSQVLGAPSKRRSGPSLRLVAGLAGVVFGAVALVFAAPALRGPRGGAPQPAPPERAATSAGGAPTETNAGAESEVAKSVREPEPSLPEPAAPAGDGRAQLQLAKAALAENHPGDAVAAFDKAFAAAPSLREQNAAAYAKALTEDGKLRFDEDSDAAAQRFRAALAVDPNSFDAHFFLAKVYTRKSDPEGALQEYQEAIRINPKSADAQFNLGFVYFSQRRYDDALRQYEKVVELKPAYLADVFYNLAACYEQMKRKSDAVATLRRGLQAVPNSDLLRQRLKQLGG